MENNNEQGDRILLVHLRGLWTPDLTELATRLESGEMSLGFARFFTRNPDENRRRAGLARQIIADRSSSELT